MSIYFYFYQDELLYIGSSFDMEERIQSHKDDYKKSKLQFYKDLKANGLRMEDLELEEVKTGIINVKTLKLLEGDCQRFYEPQCNIRIEGRTRKEYYKDNKEKFNERSRLYNKTDKFKTYLKKYNEKNKDLRAEYRNQYYKKNKAKISEYGKQHYEANKNKINQQRRINKAKKKLATIQEE